jgi:hypothetical protein
MAYYLTGDYYKGDYYGGARGDPGLFSFLGGLAKSVFKIGTGFVTGGPAGAIGAGIGVLRGGAGMAAGFAQPGGPPGGLHLPGTGVSVVPGNILPGRPSVFQPSAGTGGMGYHLNKSAHRAQPAHAKKSYYVRNRHMNPANPRALRRAIRREQHFVALAKRVLRGTGITIGRHSFGRKRIGARKR